MNDPIDISDLRPAPRVTPMAVLWAMLAIAVGGVVWLVSSGMAPTQNESVASALVTTGVNLSTPAPRDAASSAR